MATIRAVRCFQVSGHDEGVLSPEERQAQMLDIYPEFAARGSAKASDRIEAIYVEIEANDGTRGIFGPIFAESAAIIRSKLAPHLIGRDPLAGEYLWDILYRQDRHARKGNQMMAISALDNALWDLRGKLLGQPV
ncbi:MAG: mandelate racemase, partial [Chloroflexota bacterium]|nr:mandelate racemase [Chloroflexota bacterium]